MAALPRLPKLFITSGAPDRKVARRAVTPCVTDQQPVARKVIQGARHDACQQYLQRLRVRRRNGVKVLSTLRRREHAVQYQQVQMHVEVQRTEQPS